MKVPKPSHSQQLKGTWAFWRREGMVELGEILIGQPDIKCGAVLPHVFERAVALGITIMSGCLSAQASAICAVVAATAVSTRSRSSRPCSIGELEFSGSTLGR